jgi:KaiC/GvpD/RAD55 family RecA-like ATPase
VSRQQPVQSATNGDRNVLVVVRRREAPYDTKVLHGRIRDGRLIVNARGMTIR